MNFGVEIRTVATRQQARDFVEVATIALSGNPRWVRPLDLEQSLMFNPLFSPFAKTNPIQRFVAYRDGRPAGRVAAIENREHLAKHKDQTGHFGFFDCIDDADVARALMDAAEAWLSSRGLKKISGPFNASVNHEIGMLVHGFDEPHVVRTNYAPPHYAKHLETLGYRKAMDVQARRIDVRHSADFVTRVRRATTRRPVSGLTIRKLRYRDWRSSFVQLLKLYNETWAENWNAVPLSEQEAKAIADLMMPMVKPGWIEIAEIHGEPVALLAMIPDVNEALDGLNGKLMPFGWMRLISRIHASGTRRARIPLFGIAPRWRARADGALAGWHLVANAIETGARNGIDTIEMSWMLETNRAVLLVAGKFEKSPYRVFRIFEKDL